jgi:hypothetical protein
MGIILIFLLIVIGILALIFIGFWNLFFILMIGVGGYFLVKLIIKKVFLR